MANPLMRKFLPFDVVDVGLYVVNLVLDVADARVPLRACDQ